MHVARHVLLQVLYRLLEFRGKLYRSGVGLFGDSEKHSRLSSLRGYTQLGLLRPYLHVGYVGERDRRSLSRSQSRLRQLLHIVLRHKSPDYILVAILVYHASACVLVHPTRCRHHLREAHSVVFHPVGMYQYLIFLYVAAQHSHLCHSSGREQSRAHGPVGKSPEVEHRRAVCRQSHYEHLTED